MIGWVLLGIGVLLFAGAYIGLSITLFVFGSALLQGVWT